MLVALDAPIGDQPTTGSSVSDESPIILSEITDPNQLTALEILGLGRCTLLERPTHPIIDELNDDPAVTHRAYIISGTGASQKISYFQRGKELRELAREDQEIQLVSLSGEGAFNHEENNPKNKTYIWYYDKKSLTYSLYYKDLRYDYNWFSFPRFTATAADMAARAELSFFRALSTDGKQVNYLSIADLEEIKLITHKYIRPWTMSEELRDRFKYFSTTYRCRQKDPAANLIALKQEFLKKLASLTGYAPTISKREIKQRYDQLSLEYHPDRPPNKKPRCDAAGNQCETDQEFCDRVARNTEDFRVSTAAYHILTNKISPDPEEPGKDLFPEEARRNAKITGIRNTRLSSYYTNMTVPEFQEFLEKNKGAAVVQQIMSHLTSLKDQADRTKILANILRLIKAYKISISDVTEQTDPQKEVWSYLLTHVFNEDGLTECLCSQVLPYKFKIFSFYQQYLYRKSLAQQWEENPIPLIVSQRLRDEHEKKMASLAHKAVTEYRDKISYLLFVVEAYQWTRKHYVSSVEGLEGISENRRLLAYLMNDDVCQGEEYPFGFTLSYLENAKRNSDDNSIPTPTILQYDFNQKYDHYKDKSTIKKGSAAVEAFKDFLASLSINLSTLSAEFSTKILEQLKGQHNAIDFSQFCAMQKEILSISASVIYGDDLRKVYKLLRPNLVKQQQLQNEYDKFITANQITAATICQEKLEQLNLVITALKVHVADFAKEVIAQKCSLPRTVWEQDAPRLFELYQSEEDPRRRAAFYREYSKQQNQDQRIWNEKIREELHDSTRAAENYCLINCCEKVIGTLDHYAHAEKIGRHQNVIKHYLQSALGVAIITLLCSSVVGIFVLLSPKVREIIMTSFFYTATESTLVRAKTQVHNTSMRKMTDGSAVMYSIISQLIEPVELLCERLKSSAPAQIILLKAALTEIRTLASKQREKLAAVTFFGLVNHDERRKAFRDKSEALCIQASNILKKLELVPEVKKELDGIIQEAELFFNIHFEKAATHQGATLPVLSQGKVSSPPSPPVENDASGGVSQDKKESSVTSNLNSNGYEPLGPVPIRPDRF